MMVKVKHEGELHVGRDVKSTKCNAHSNSCQNRQILHTQTLTFHRGQSEEAPNN